MFRLITKGIAGISLAPQGLISRGLAVSAAVAQKQQTASKKKKPASKKTTTKAKKPAAPGRRPAKKAKKAESKKAIRESKYNMRKTRYCLHLQLIYLCRAIEPEEAIDPASQEASIGRVQSVYQRSMEACG